MGKIALILILMLAPSALADAVSPKELEKANGHDIVILGEIHDNGLHHAGQAAFIRALSPTAIVFEMLNPDQAMRLTPEAAADFENLNTVIGWSDAGWPDIALYKPIFQSLSNAHIYGASRSRTHVRRAFGEGAAAVFGADAERFGLLTPLSEGQQQTRETLQFEAHCDAMPRNLMSGMVEAQRFRDAMLAQSALTALETHGAPVVVIAGNGHSHNDWGMRRMIGLADPNASVFTVGFVEPKMVGEIPMEFDLTITTKAAERPDPCAQFNKN